MPLIGGLSSAITQMPVNDKVLGFFQKTGQEGSLSLMVPEGSVIAGRSAASAKRGGWLELQERLVEEAVVAVVWLWGVKAMANKFGAALKKRFNLDPEIAWLKPLGKKGLDSVDQNPQELFSTSANGIGRLQKIKGVNLALSLGVTLAVVSLLIPWLNQKKTEWVIKKFYKPKNQAPQPGQHQSPLLPATAAQPAQPLPSAAPVAASAFAAQGGASAGRLPSSANSAFAPAGNAAFAGASKLTSPGAQPFPQMPNATPAARPVQFGGIGQSLGHLVEQTDYGNILAVDTGITGGRAVVAGRRSPFEAAEIVFRDGVSLYFYILSTPHIMKLMSGLLNKAFNSSLMLAPKVSQDLNAEINKKLSGAVSNDEIRRVVNGMEHPALDALRPTLAAQMQSADRVALNKLLAQESKLYGVSDSTVERTLGYLEKAAASQGQARVTTDAVADLLKAVKAGVGPFGKLSMKERTNLTLAVKQSFRHAAGITLDALRKDTAFRNTLAALPTDASREELAARIKSMAERDSLDAASTLYRRNLLLYRDILGPTHPVIQDADALASWMEKAVRRQVPLAELVREEGREIARDIGGLKKFKGDGAVQSALEALSKGDLSGLEALETSLKQAENPLRAKLRRSLDWIFDRETIESKIDGLKNLSKYGQGASRDKLAGQSLVQAMKSLQTAAEQGTPQQREMLKTVQELLKRHADEIEGALLKNEGRLFSLSTQQGQAALDAKLTEMLNGGLRHNGIFLCRALRGQGYLGESFKKYFNTGKAHELQSHLNHYLDTLLDNFKTEAGKLQAKTGNQPATIAKKDAAQILDRFQKLSQNLHIGSRGLALGVTLLGLGVLVPKMQNAMTKKITGKNEQPGIAEALEKINGKNAANAQEVPPPPGYVPLRRDNFQAFKQASAQQAV